MKLLRRAGHFLIMPQASQNASRMWPTIQHIGIHVQIEATVEILLRGSFQDSDDSDNDLASCDVFVYSVNDRGLKELAGEMFR